MTAASRTVAKVKMCTVRTLKGVLYQVVHNETKEVLWERYVGFSRGWRRRGGNAFTEAAQEQERRTMELSR